MANIKKFGTAVVVTSAAKLEDIRKIAKYRPEALILYSEGEEKEPMFGVGISGCRSGSISKCGIEFGGASEDGFAQVTTHYDGPDENVKQALADSIGPQVMMLTQLEETFPAVIADIDANVEKIMESITIG